MTISLSTLSLVLGGAIALLHGYALVRPEAYAASLRKFPRSVPLGVALMLGATAWFLYYLSQESIADLANYKPFLYVLFGGVGIGACIFVQDFLSVRALAVLLMLLGKLMVDTGRIHLKDSSWTLVIQTLAYIFVVAGIWLTISPWRLRDLIDWTTRDAGRLRIISILRLCFGLFLVGLGIFAFRNL